LSSQAIGSRVNVGWAVLVLALGLGGVALAQRSSGTSHIRVTLLDGNLRVAPTILIPGKVTLVVANHGRLSHALAIVGTDLQPKRTVKLASGNTATLTVTVKAGNYRIWDPLRGSVRHATTLKVRAPKTSGAYGGISTWGTGKSTKPSGGVTSGSKSSGGPTSGSGAEDGMGGAGCGG
jgi:hypothetical protein